MPRFTIKIKETGTHAENFMSLNRHTFLLHCLGLSISPLVFGKTLTPKSSPDIILGGGQFRTADSEKIHYALSILDLQNMRRDLSEMAFLPHGIHPKPTDTNYLALFEKKGPGACEYDLKKKSITRSIKPLNNRYFYSHGAYSMEGNNLFSTETYLDTLEGVIAIRDSKTMEHIDDFPSYGKEPHECKLIDSGKILVVTNGGGVSTESAPSVCYIDIQSQKLLEQVTLTTSRINTGHLAVSRNGSLLVVSAPRAGLTGIPAVLAFDHKDKSSRLWQTLPKLHVKCSVRH